MPDTIEELAQASFVNFGDAMRAFAIPEDGSIPVVYRDWQAVTEAKNTLDTASRQLSASIEALRDDPTISADERAFKIQQNKDLYDSVERASVKQIQAGLTSVRNALVEAQASDLVPAPAAERSLIRDEIDRLVTAATRPTSDGQGGRPFKPGKPVLVALTELAQRNPARYGAEVAGDYGAALMQAAGEVTDIPNLKANIMALTPGSTPKAQSARAALTAMKATRIEGMTSGLSFTARQRVEAALKPPAPPRGAYLIDTIRPIG